MNRTFTLWLCLSAVLLLVCSDEQNPFADSANARAVFLDKTQLPDGATLPFYTTCTLHVAVLVSEQVSSFALHADSSRYFADTTVAGPDSREYCFPVSFVDTGWKVVTLTTSRRGGDQVMEHRRVHVVSPLRPLPAVGQLDSLVDFRCDSGVGDRDVWYHWYYGDGTRYAVTHVAWRFPEVSRRINAAGVLPGWVYVSLDQQGEALATPADSFRISLSDSVGPSIFCLNGAVNDTIRTPQTSLYFLVQVVDAGGLDRVEIDDVPDSSVGSDSYGRVYAGLDGLPGGVRQVSVRAVDRNLNVSSRAFWLLYDPGAAGTPQVRISLYGLDTALTGRNQYYLLGRLFDPSRSQRYLRVAAAVNGVASTDTQLVQMSGVEVGFGLPLQLSAAYNTVLLTALDSSGAALADTTAVILYDASLVDDQPPAILAVSASGRSVAPGVITYVPDSSCLVEVTVRDESGVALVSVAGAAAVRSGQGPAEWLATLDSVPYGAAREVVVAASDSSPAANDTSYRFLLQRNTLASVQSGTVWPARLFVNLPCSVSFAVTDEEPGNVAVTLEAAPASMACERGSGPGSWVVHWTPAPGDTGVRLVSLSLFDGYQRSAALWQPKVVRDSSLLLALATGSAEFPRVLEAGRDSLSLTLRVQDGKGTPPFAWKAVFAGETTVLLDAVGAARDQFLGWLPLAADTGLHHLLVTVRDGEGDADTLYHDLEVVRPNADSCRLVRLLPPLTDTLASGEIDMRAAVAPVVVTLQIIDSDHPFTECWVRTVARRGLVNVDTLDSARAFTVLLDTVCTSAHDTTRVYVRDRTGSVDSCIIAAVYPFPRPRPAAGWVWPRRFVAGSTWSDTLTVVDQPGHTLTLDASGVPAGMSFTPLGQAGTWLAAWTPAASDSGSHSVSVTLADGYQDTLIAWTFGVLADSSRLVHFAPGSASLPTYIEVGHQLGFSLSLASGTGLASFRYLVRLADGPVLLDTTTDARAGIGLVWTPATADTGTRYVLASVTDAGGDADTLYRAVQVVPANASPCTLTMALPPGLDTTASGALDMSQASQPETLLFVVHDADHPLTEEYTLFVTRGGITTVEPLGPARSFQMVLDTGGLDVEDTVYAVLMDATGTSDLVVVRVYHGVRPPATFGNARLEVSLDARRASVTTLTTGDTVWANTWQSASSRFAFSANPGAGTPPRYDTSGAFPALDFERRSGSNLLVVNSRASWAWLDSAFTVFAVARLDALASDSSHTLLAAVDSWTTYMGLGVYGRYIGAFSDGSQSASNLAPQVGRWYVYSYVSLLGKQAGVLQVTPYLNGTAGTVSAVSSTVQGFNTMVGATERYYASNAWEGQIAELLMYRGALSDGERRQVEAYLSAKYGIALAL